MRPKDPLKDARTEHSPSKRPSRCPGHVLVGKRLRKSADASKKVQECSQERGGNYRYVETSRPWKGGWTDGEDKNKLRVLGTKSFRMNGGGGYGWEPRTSHKDHQKRARWRSPIKEGRWFQAMNLQSHFGRNLLVKWVVF